MSDFNCTKCGACCKLVPDRLLEQHKLPKAKGGGCGHLKPDLSCGIYNTRPDVCRIDRTWELHYRHQMTWEQWKALNESACKVLESDLKKLK